MMRMNSYLAEVPQVRFFICVVFKLVAGANDREDWKSRKDACARGPAAEGDSTL